MKTGRKILALPKAESYNIICSIALFICGLF